MDNDQNKKESYSYEDIKTDEFSFIKSKGLSKDYPPIWKVMVKQSFDNRYLEIKNDLGTDNEDSVLKALASETQVDKRILKRFKNNGSTNHIGYAVLFDAFRFVKLQLSDLQTLFEVCKDNSFTKLNLTYGHTGRDYMSHQENLQKGFALIEELWEKKNTFLKGTQKPTEKIARITELNEFVSRIITKIHSLNLEIYSGQIPIYIQPPGDLGITEEFKGYMICLVSFHSQEQKINLPKRMSLDVDWSRTWF
jgi:hypothetical protein